MAIVFFIEIYQTQPNFSSKIDQDGVISIYSSLNKEVAEQNNGKHKDIGYSAKIDACVEFDCSGFVVGQNAAGKIDLCVDCPTPQQPSAPSSGGNCGAYAALNSYKNNLPAQVLNTGPTAAAYETHLENATNAAGARSGYWLGLTDCDSVATPHQCGVSCGTSGVALCYPTSGGSGLQGFGDIKILNGETYQIYDPVQLHAAGISPGTGMSFTLAAAAPNWSAASSGTQCNGPTGIDMGGAENCLSNNPSPPANFNSVGGGTGLPQPSGYIAASGSSLFSGVLVSGVGSSGTSIGIGDQCFYVGSGSKAATASGGLIFGGSGTPVVSLESLGGSSYNSCQECVEDNVSVPCQSLASSQISINGAPEYSSSSGWGPASTGSVVWENWNNGDPNTEGYSEGFKEMTCAMDDKDGQTHGPLGDGARAIMPGISCTNDGGDKRCKPNHKPSSMLVDGIITPPNLCCQNVTVGNVYQGFGFGCEDCCRADIGVSVFYAPVFKGFGCPCEDDGGSCSDPLCWPGACSANLDCFGPKPGAEGYTPPNSDATGPISSTGEKTEKSEDEKQLCVRYGNDVQKTSVAAVSANVGPLSFAEITYDKKCSDDGTVRCSETFIAFFGVGGDGLVDVGGEIVGPDENDEPSTYPDGSPIEPVSVGNLKGALERLGGEDISIFINVSSCHMANSGANPWTLYGTGDVTIGGEIANPSTPDGTGGVKSAYDPNSPYGNDDDGVPCG